MRKSKEEAAETRARIIRKASKEFNQHGIAGTGLADVMKSAGLTHGGFYKHFQSKDELVAEALERGLEKSFQAIEHSADERAIAELINEYLSPVHRDDFDNACPLPALGTELWRAGGKTRQKASEGVLRFVSLVEKHLKGLPAKDRKVAGPRYRRGFGGEYDAVSHCDRFETFGPILTRYPGLCAPALTANTVSPRQVGSREVKRSAITSHPVHKRYCVELFAVKLGIYVSPRMVRAYWPPEPERRGRRRTLRRTGGRSSAITPSPSSPAISLSW